MAFDITKSFTTPTLPKAEAQSLADKSAALRSRAKPEKVAGPGHSFEEELTSEPVKNTQSGKKQPLPTDSRREPQSRDDLKANPADNNKSLTLKPSQTEKAEPTKNPVPVDPGTSQTPGAVPVAVDADMVDNPSADLLNQFASENKDDILKSPVAALLAANLQTISPDELPDLLSKNKFLSMALFGSESESILGQTAEPSELFEALGIPANLADELKSVAGEDQKLSAAQIFSAIGLEPGFIAKQLNALRQQTELPFVPPIDGEQLFSLNAGDVSKDSKKSIESSAQVVQSILGRGLPQKDIIRLNDLVVGNSDHDRDIGPAEGLAELAGALVNPVQASAATSSPNLENDAALPEVGTKGVSQFDVFKQWKQSAIDGSANPASIEPSEINPAVAGNPILGKSATFDAFFELGQKIERLNPENVTQLDVNQIEEIVAEPASAPSFMDSVITRFSAASLQKPVAVSTGELKQSANQMVTGDLAPRTEVNENVVTDVVSKPGNYMKTATDMAPQIVSHLVKPSTDLSARKFTVDEFLGDVTAGRINLDFAKSDSDSFAGSEGGDASDFAGDFSGENVLGRLAGGDGKTHAFGANFASHMGEASSKVDMTPAQRAELAQKVMDSSAYLIRQGSGSVRLDLSSPETGPLEIAVSLADNKVDIKVFTESDPVREAMIADLSRLKESLQAQNVNLNNVQVGVGQRFGGSSSFDQGQQFNQQKDMREAFANTLSGFSGRSAPEVKIPDLSMSALSRMNQISADGRVQIRI